MLTGKAAIEANDWSKLGHAYGMATDTPVHLHALFGKDPDAQTEAIRHLNSAVIHQGTAYPATGPAALVVAGLLSDDQIDLDVSIRIDLMAFLVSVVEASRDLGLSIDELARMAMIEIEPPPDSDEDWLYTNEEAVEAFYAKGLLACIEAAPVLLPVMRDALSHPDPRVRSWGAMGASLLAGTEALREQSGDVARYLTAMALTARNSDERSTLVLAIGDLGVAPTAFLDDPSPAVRLCAALAPGLKDDPDSIFALLRTLERHAGEIDGWFVERPPQFVMQPRFSVVARVVEQVKDFDRLVNAAVAVAAITDMYCVDFDWGPLLTAAFPEGSGLIQTEAQRRYLGALVARRDLWDSDLWERLRVVQTGGAAV